MPYHADDGHFVLLYIYFLEGAAALRRHEIVGIVTEVGSGVTEFKVGDRAGIGCFVRACRECNQCKKGTDQYCSKMVRCHMLTTTHCVPRDMLAAPACGPCSQYSTYLYKCFCRLSVLLSRGASSEGS